MNRVRVALAATLLACAVLMVGGGCGTHEVFTKGGEPKTVPADKALLLSETVGQGTVSPSEGEYDLGASVSLRAKPAAGWRFDHWEIEVWQNNNWEYDGDATANPLALTMDADYCVTAVFIEQFTLTMHIKGEGTVDLHPSGGTYDAGTAVTLTAEPADNWNQWVFDAWTGDLSGTADSETLVMDSDKDVTAWFDPTRLDLHEDLWAVLNTSDVTAAFNNGECDELMDLIDGTGVDVGVVIVDYRAGMAMTCREIDVGAYLGGSYDPMCVGDQYIDYALSAVKFYGVNGGKTLFIAFEGTSTAMPSARATGAATAEAGTAQDVDSSIKAASQIGAIWRAE